MKFSLSTLALCTALMVGATPVFAASTAPVATATSNETSFHKVNVDGINLFYREAGPKDAPVILLLHGFPTSSHMFRNLIPQLADRYHVIAPDYPGYGQSDMPPVGQFAYTFDHVAQLMNGLTEKLGLAHYTMYVQDYGAPVGFRLAHDHPERINAIVVQNGNAYEEGIKGKFWDPLKAFWRDKSEANAAKLRPFLELAGTRWHYTEGVRDLAHLSPDAWTLDQAYLDRPGNKDIQLEMFYSYGSNVKLYPQWQAYFRQYQPPMLIVWGKNDKSFDVEGALAYKRDLPNAELHLLDTGHFALEEDGAQIAQLMRAFLARH